MALIRLGIDIGSTTVKLAALDKNGRLLHGTYERHRSDIGSTLTRMLDEAARALGGSLEFEAAVTGSAGIGVASRLGLPFVQEVIACSRAVETYLPGTDVAVELGGEDAKITYFGEQLDQRMNGSCAGGTGAFIDQMAVLLGVDAAGIDELASRARTVYPIAARCGVFAKADIQPLINEGARREDIAASVLQAVVNQTISGLACGRPIRGRVAFLGGPLHFLPELRKRFAETLRLKPEEMLVPADGRLFVALGAALCASEENAARDLSRASAAGSASGTEANLQGQSPTLEALVAMARDSRPVVGDEQRLQPLFADEAARETFRERHAAAALPRLAEGQTPALPLFLGLDAGSTTSKLVLIDAAGNLVHSFYAPNGGHPLTVLVDALRETYKSMPAGAAIGRACATGYGEGLVCAALGVDEGEVETVAHSLAAERILPGVDAVLDIGGQDMKFLKVKEGVISSVVLNEACSSGCGSFLETFASSLDFGAADFARVALDSSAPVDLGSRCTVFMNSRVKQAQKEGASPADISAGLAYSVIRNALQKVIRLRDPRSVGAKVVVQGGTFASDAVLRAFELVSGIQPVRPAETGLMGAYGAALIARARWREGSASSILGPNELESFVYHAEPRRCPGCANACLLTVTRFGEPGDEKARAHVTGNRCERGEMLAIAAIGGGGSDAANAGKSRERRAAAAHAAGEAAYAALKREAPPDLYAWKYERLFRYRALDKGRKGRGSVGIPRILNLYENYPFWFTLFTELGFRVELSPRSSKTVYEKGMDTIPSESACYPAKLAHGHAVSLAERDLGFVFYPCIPREERFVEGSDNSFNCPIVTSYPEVMRNNIEAFRDGSMLFLDPFLPIADPAAMRKRIVEELASFGVAPDESARALAAAYAEQEAFRAELREQGEAALEWVERTGGHGIVLAGRPYHIDPEIHHGIPSLVTGLGMAVLSEDSIAHLGIVERKLRVVDQWAYHSRLYAAASFVSRRDDLDLVQLVSFGCGLDAVTADQVEEILSRTGKIYTGIKIDEHANLGAARIRLRSLLAAVEERRAAAVKAHESEPLRSRPLFTEKMRREYTILAPQMSPIHFRIVEAAFRHSGYNLDILPVAGPAALDEGLRSVNNDACYPSILVTGQLIEALTSGRYDPDRTALLISQTGGGCRASNYIAFIRKALADAGLERVPVISLSAASLERNPGFRISVPFVLRGLEALVYGDALMRLLYRTRPYEVVPGSAQALVDSWTKRCNASLDSASFLRFARNLKAIVRDFDALALRDTPRRPRIGVVGEILVKFHPDANGHIVETVEAEGGEAVVPDLFDFLLYSTYNGIFRRRKLGGSLKGEALARLGIVILSLLRSPLSRALGRSGRFEAPPTIHELAAGVDGIVQLGNATGEGWFLTAEMVELIHSGASGVVCLQPFACLPNHVTGKGMLKELRRRYPAVPVAAIDFDPGASEVNQLNRLKLLMANARRGLRPAQPPQPAAGLDEGEAELAEARREEAETDRILAESEAAASSSADQETA